MAPKVMRKPAASKTTKGKGQIGQESRGGQIGQEKLGGHKGQGSLCGQTEGLPSFVADGGVSTTPSEKSTPGCVASRFDPGTAHLVPNAKIEIEVDQALGSHPAANTPNHFHIS